MSSHVVQVKVRSNLLETKSKRISHFWKVSHKPYKWQLKSDVSQVIWFESPIFEIYLI